MKPERWQQVDKLLQAALALDPADRASFLNHACKSDAALRQEIDSLLASHERAGSFIESPAIEASPSLIVTNAADSILEQPIGPYRILSHLGSGGMGEVYLAQDARLGRKVALKILPDYFTTDEQRVKRFEQEAQAASALNHPNIITIYDIGEVEGRHFIATEYIEGQTLRQRIASHKFSLNEALDVAAQAAGALAAAHQAGIVHRDIKPENIMLRPDGLVKVLDFGLAKLTGARHLAPGTQAPTVAKFETEPGTIVGTANYMSPEQARGQAVDARTDIFSLGAVIYEMVAGRAPFEGETSTDVIVSILEKEPPPLRRYEPDAPQELQRIVSKALAKDREERYQTIKDILIDLRKLREELAFEAKAVVTANQLPAETSEARAQTTSSAEYIVGALARNKSIALAALVALAIAVAAIIYFSRGGGQKPIDSLAVLPLANAGGDPNAEYLSDGITESIIYNLSQMPDLRVMSFSSVSSYKMRDPRSAGQDLNVRALLVGKLVQRGDGLSVSVELVDAEDNRVLWGQQYNRKLTDILAVQQEISSEISQKLRLRLSGEEQKQLTRSYTDNPEAYRLYLLGRYFWNKRREVSIRKAIEYFEQATHIDPNYALAYSGLADSYYNLSNTGPTQPPSNYYQKTKEAALRAVELDEGLAESHTSLGIVREWFEWDFAAAETEYKRALELNPGYAAAHHRYGVYLAFRGRFDEALAEFRQALQIEPLSLVINHDLAFVYHFMRDYDRAIEQTKKAIEIDPSWPRAHANLAIYYTEKDMYDEALAEIQKLPGDLNSSALGRDALLGRIYAKQGRRAEAMKILKEMEGLSKQRYITPVAMVRLYTSLGYKDEAFAWVQKAYEERSWYIPRINIDPTDADLRSDPRVVDLLRRAGFPQ
jgi:serine/threonine-protein kinase